MLYEYAVEPRAIGSDWRTFRYIFEKFGFDKGRLISEYPKRWLREVYDASLGLPPVEKKRIEEALSQARKNKLVRCVRQYDPAVGDWLQNAIAEHGRSPFHAIISAANPNGDAFVLPAEVLDESHPLMAVSHDCAVARDAPSLASAMKQMLRFGSRILFVDPFFDPYSNRYKSTLRACLEIVSNTNPRAACEIHYRYHENKPANAELEREAASLFRGVIPDGMKVVLFCWKEKDGGADFHARYLLTERGGIGVDAGFSAEGNHQTTDMHLMSYELTLEKLKCFARNASDYELVGPVLGISSGGVVEHV